MRNNIKQQKKTTQKQRTTKNGYIHIKLEEPAALQAPKKNTKRHPQTPNNFKTSWNKQEKRPQPPNNFKKAMKKKQNISKNKK